MLGSILLPHTLFTYLSSRKPVEHEDDKCKVFGLACYECVVIEVREKIKKFRNSKM